jgi:hypothetical protein
MEMFGNIASGNEMSHVSNHSVISKKTFANPGSRAIPKTQRRARGNGIYKLNSSIQNRESHRQKTNQRTANDRATQNIKLRD